MAEIWRWGTELIRALQGPDAPLLDAFFIAVSAVGSREFFLAMLPLVLWSVDERVGKRLLLFLLVSAQLNFALKQVFQYPRPLDLFPELQLVPTTGYGLPSGHAQDAVVVWGALASWSRQTRARVFYWLLVVLIGLSRVYLGVHFPADVVVGWAVGAALLVVFLRWLPGLEAWLAGRFAVKMAMALLLPAMPLALFPEPEMAIVAGVLTGTATGILLGARTVPFAAGRGSVGRRLSRYLAGQALLVPTYVAIRLLVETPDGTLWSRFIAYALLGLLMTWGIPALLLRVGLLDRRAAPA